MPSPQHVYRRGHVFWWRRSHRLFSGAAIDVRISLGTVDRLEARNRGAALTAATSQVVNMLNEGMKAADARPTDDELKAIARKAYGERLAQFCDDQRAWPHHAAEHSVANRTWADYYDRLARNGGHVPMLPDEDRALKIMGWDAQRIASLRAAIDHVLDGHPAISERFVDSYLKEYGYRPHNGLRRMVERALYPAYRDACLEAERRLQTSDHLHAAQVDGTAPSYASSVPPATAPADDGEALSDFIKLVIDDRVADGEWDAKSGRQARSTVALFELVIGRKAFATYTRADFASFMRKLRFVPERYDMTSAKSRAAVLNAIAAGEAAINADQPRSSFGEERSGRTRNRHLSSLRAVYRWAKKNGRPVPDIEFESLFVVVSKRVRARSERPATPGGDVAALFALPVYTGCLPHRGGTGQKVLHARFTAGDAIIHDAFYWVPLLLYYTGARREELCKLSPDDVLRGEVPHIWIDFTEFGRIKNDHSVRPVPLHSELVRLGFLEFVDECRSRGYDVLFPELRATNETQGFGDVYYKNVWSHLKRQARLTGDATNHGMRHRFSSELKVKKVFSEFRRDVMGHAGLNINEERYSEIGPLMQLRAIVEELPSVTNHLTGHPGILPPRPHRRPQPQKAPCANLIEPRR